MLNLNIIKRINTARYLKTSQLFYYLLRRGLPARSVNINQTIPARAGVGLVRPVSTKGIYVSDYEFEFLNTTKNIAGEYIDWKQTSMSRLWQYNLHYFDFLRESERSHENKVDLIDSWIASNPQGCEPAWEPFTTSLRIVNWIFFFHVEMRDVEIPETWLRSLFAQAQWLEKNDEKHILANHYFENIKALMFAGVFFKGKTADKWLITSQKILKQQVIEQFLSDGGHYEKSPMYHCLMLENCLDLYNLVANNRAICDAKFQLFLKNHVEHSLHWLSDIQYHNGELPLFNDASNYIAPNYLQLSQYASRLFLYEPEASIISGGKLIELDASGYYGLEANSDKFIIDCGDISPSYQPGHTHCDFLSFEVVFNDQAIIVDSGVYEYYESDMRRYVRSTRAHNTVSVDGDEQSELWSVFRVARRAKKIYAHITQSQHGANFKGGYQGFHAVKGQAIHLREVDILLNDMGNSFKQLNIHDEIRVSGEHQVESYLHFHPGIECNNQGNGIIRLMLHGESIAVVIIDKDCAYEISYSFYCPEFGKKIENQMIVMNKVGRDKIHMKYEIKKV